MVNEDGGQEECDDDQQPPGPGPAAAARSEASQPVQPRDRSAAIAAASDVLVVHRRSEVGLAMEGIGQAELEGVVSHCRCPFAVVR